MCLQNRVTPFGDIVAISQRGLLTGNRGIIHDPATRTLLQKRWTTKTWLVCSCDYKGRRRSVMAGRSWTELFFLDEAVALAAGHRPCFLCRREAAEHFRTCWSTARDERDLSAAEIDTVLHGERLNHGRRRIRPIVGALGSLPDGTMVAAGGAAFLLLAGSAYRWTNEGYAAPERLQYADELLTPPSTVAALCAGYRPALHPTANMSLDGRNHG
jgi:hypothetical protein